MHLVSTLIGRLALCVDALLHKQSLYFWRCDLMLRRVRAFSPCRSMIVHDLGDRHEPKLGHGGLEAMVEVG